jgi:hypothetical protein
MERIALKLTLKTMFASTQVNIVELLRLLATSVEGEGLVGSFCWEGFRNGRFNCFGHGWLVSGYGPGEVLRGYLTLGYFIDYLLYVPPQPITA